MIKNIFIDLDDTLWATYENSRESMYEVYSKNNWAEYMQDFETFWQCYWTINENLWEEYRQGRISKYELKTQRFQKLFAGIKEWSQEDILSFNNDFLAHTSTKTALIPDSIEVLSYLHRYYRVYILSNGFREVQSAKINRSGLAPYIDRIILSEDAGCNKPHRGIFQYAFSVTNSRVSESIMIGDSWAADIEGAHNAFIPSVWFNPKENPLPEEKKAKPLYIIKKLKELLLIF
ncbi:YjjG family noncanonical pyrimidine nucleotidase [Porphyromonas circumdentaria]|uniref:Putative hydrolase of the HAD superfamily n=1 Tax=Porphyromonas circumdentaria TaxID=29524 RepID=A0A1T4KLP1_9PORP|nr:YjjG family noncanonical pyrimidine nucleotidase [Porphyromonas circumdentaria]MBB6274992.1 putative hydrolase of the HAD superfamily [Porphyromonas circumdentaria]MDO4722193.1 YjjG family noncanonical pyrimidine nucleotidase [Porphyromonas circumdentaria]SJZ43316.1 putative hydrolase of the HAD superfamily [Porphyromonas circumdentaria]